MNYQDKTKEELIQELRDLQNKYNSIVELYEKDTIVQKQIETALKKSQLLLNETGKIAKVGGWEFDVKTFEQIWTEEIFNILEIDISHGTLKVEQGIQFFAPSSKQIAEQAVQRAIEFGEPYDLEVEIITTKGKYRWVRSIGKANYENGKIVSISGIFQDITELKQTEILKQRNIDIENENEKIKQLNEELKIAKEKAELSEQSYSLLINNIPDTSILLFDKELRYLIVGGGEIEKSGFDKSLIQGRTLQEAYPKDVVDLFEPLLRKAFNGDTTVLEMQYAQFTYLQQIIPIRNNLGNIFATMQIASNITARKQTEQELIKAKEKAEENEVKFRNTIEYSPIPTAIAKNDGELIFLNKQFINTYGYTLEEIPTIGKWFELVYPDEEYRNFAINDWGKEVENSIKNNTPINVKEYLVTCKNCEIKTVAVSAYFEKDISIGLFQDITDRKKTEIELIKAKEKAEESDHLKTAFLQNMSHEIRTPLNAISGFSGMLNKPELSEEKRKSFVSIIQNSSKQLISIVTDILTISALETKQEKQNIDKVCINNIIVDLLAIFKQQAQNQNISLYAKQQLSDKQSEIYTDKTKITQILTNLLTNALKFTHEGFIEFGYNLKNCELEFYVKDSGIGIKIEFHEMIFERFRQADKSINKLYGGTGLGLAISKAFAELLGGKIWVQSELEKGSIFYFTIPYKPVNEIDKTTTPTKQNENFRTVLVAEDEEYNFLFIEELLIDMDLKLIHAKDGRETVEIFKSNPDIDLILMDIKMPIMTGHEAAKIIKEQKPNLPIVAQSAYALEHERAKYEGIFDDYLTKPIDEEDLKQKVLKYIDKQINKWL